jgi:predicted DNA-binding protein (MmcQ/YjbR family)
VDLARFRAACAALPAATYVNQWGGAHVYKVGGKIFAIAGLGGGRETPHYAFKASDMSYELLIEHGIAQPARYLARAHWVQLTEPDALPDDDLLAYLAQAHGLVAAKLTRAERKRLGLG